jgi:hypothetical protein
MVHLVRKYMTVNDIRKHCEEKLRPEIKIEAVATINITLNPDGTFSYSIKQHTNKPLIGWSLK